MIYPHTILIVMNYLWYLQALPVVSHIRYQSTIPDNSHIKPIYEGKLTSKIKFVKIFSLSSSAAGLLVQPYLLPKVLATQSTVALVGVIVITGFFAFCTPLLLHMITSRYVTHMDYDSKKNVYVATVFNILTRKRQVSVTN